LRREEAAVVKPKKREQRVRLYKLPTPSKDFPLEKPTFLSYFT
jgi:hypothetical protein